MSSNDPVVDLVRRRAITDEPPFALARERVVAAGRRRLRERRISLALRVTAAVAVLVALAGVPEPAEGLSPATAAAPTSFVPPTTSGS